MLVLRTLISVAVFAFWVWWMLSTRATLKAIQRKLGADAKWEETQRARACPAEQEAQRAGDWKL